MDTHNNDDEIEIGPDVNATKPAFDEKQYKHITLKKNGLEVLLVSDMLASASLDDSDSEDSEDSDDSDHSVCSDNSGRSTASSTATDQVEEAGAKKRRAAVCMSVGVGSFEDPESCQGLAHFLEHMCFMGSTKYPTENEFDSFIAKNGGDSNAYTEGEHTSFYFTVKVSSLSKALDIFAQFFISPLLLGDAVDRELNAIESEFELAKRSDSNRLQEVCCRSVRRDHPLSKFGWGNIKSIRQDPEELGLDPLKMLKTLYNERYTSENMKLCICAPMGLSELERIVVETCSDIRTQPDNAPEDWKFTPLSMEHYGLPFRGHENGEDKLTPERIIMDRVSLGCCFMVVPRNDIHKLYITWQLPSQLRHYKSKPSEYLCHLIGHESAGSVFAVAKAKGWVTSLLAGGGEGYEENTSCTLLPVSISLTEQGMCEWKKVVALVLEYIAMLQKVGPERWFFDELAQLANTEYRFMEEVDPDDLVQELAMRMLPQSGYDKADLLTGAHLLSEWNPEQISDILSSLSFDNFRVDLASSLFGRDRDYANSEADGDSDSASVDDVEVATTTATTAVFPNNPATSTRTPNIEPYFGTRYWVDEIDGETLKFWEETMETTRKDDRSSVATPISGLKMPRKNPYIAKNFELKSFPVSDTLHPLVGAYVKIQVCMGKKKKLDWVYGFVLGFDKSSGCITTSIEHDIDDLYSSFRLLEEDQEKWVPGREFVHVEQLRPPQNKGKIKCVVLGGGIGVSSPQQLNAYVSRLFDLRSASLNDEASVLRVSENRMPKLVPCDLPVLSKSSTNEFQLHILHDRLFLRPKAIIYINILCGGEVNVIEDTVRNAVATSLFVRIVNDTLSDEAYLASMAELEYGCCKSDSGIRLRFSGFSDNLFKFIDVVLHHLLEVALEDCEENRNRFDMQKESLMRGYGNSGMRSHKLATSLRLQCLRKRQYDSIELLNALKGINDFSEVVEFVREKLFVNCLLDGIICGNVTDEEDGKGLHELVMKHFARFSFLKVRSKVPKQVIAKLNGGELFRVDRCGREPTDTNSSIEMYFQIGEDNMRDRCVLDLIEHLMEEPLYDILRTKKQLGYSVNCGTRLTNKVLGYAICITSATFSVEELETHVFEFLKDFVGIMEKACEDEGFEESVRTLVEYKLEDDNNLNELVKRLWTVVSDRTLFWQQCRHEAFAILGTTQQSVFDSYKTWFLDSPKLISVRVRASGTSNSDSTDGFSAVTDIKEHFDKLYTLV